MVAFIPMMKYFVDPFHNFPLESVFFEFFKKIGGTNDTNEI